MAAAAAATTTATFPKFQTLPRELRDKIWQDSLPEKDSPALYPWKRGCWYPRRLQETDPGWDPNRGVDWELEMCHGLLDHVQVEVPLFYVNREARGFALAWMRKQNITLRFRKDKQHWVFTRPFDPMIDTVYIATDKIYEFLTDDRDRMNESDRESLLLSIGPGLPRIAVAADLFQDDLSSLSEIFCWYSAIQEVSVVVGLQPYWESYDMQLVQGQRWEAQETRGRAFAYNSRHGRFDLHDGDTVVGDETLDKQIEKACEYLSEMVSDNGGDRFEIKTVFAVTR